MRDWNEIMFSDIGNKIKGYAKVCAWIGIVLSISLGSIMFLYGLFNMKYIWYFILLGPVVAVAGCFLSWIAVIAFYGFGELIDVTNSIKKKIEKTENKEEPHDTNKKQTYFDDYKKQLEAKANIPAGPKGKLKYKCDNCNEMIDFSDTRCPWCGYENFS